MSSHSSESDSVARWLELHRSSDPWSVLVKRHDSACILFMRYVRYRWIRLFMPNRIQHIVVTLLLVSYLFVGAAAHLDVLNQLVGLGEGPQRVAQTKQTHPVPTTVCWTQYKHIPAVTKIAPAPPAVFSSLEFPRLEQYVLILASINTLICPNADVSPFSSRAPPVKPAVS